jgi:hypothetical protein
VGSNPAREELKKKLLTFIFPQMRTITMYAVVVNEAAVGLAPGGVNVMILKIFSRKKIGDFDPNPAIRTENNYPSTSL